MNELPPKFQNRSLEDIKSSYRAVQHKIDSIRNEAAIITGILPLKPGRKFWVADEINWDDPKVADLRETYFELISTSKILTPHISRLEAQKSGNLEVWKAKQKGERFLKDNFSSIEEETAFFKKNNLVRGYSSLTEALLSNPNFLNEVVL